MKKVLAVVLTVCIVFGTAAAFAQPSAKKAARDFEGREHRNLQMMNHPEIPDKNPAPRGPREDFGYCGFEGRFGRRGPNFTPDMPEEIREKAAKLAKLRVDLEEAMTSDPINKTKAIETYKKMQALENQIDAWRFEKRLELMEKMKDMKKQREEDRKAIKEKMEKIGQQREAEKTEEQKTEK